jgi:hypothetical protein
MSADSLPTVHMFWHGPPLSRLERLCMASFIANGHALNLYSYDAPVGVPAGVNVVDAEPILSRELLFTHKRTGSVGIFADWFRYRLLHRQGGIWADTDVVCLKPLRFKDPTIYAWQDDGTINNAILGLPAGHELAAWMEACCENPNRKLPYDSLRLRLRKWRRRVLQGDKRDRVRWGEYGPKGFTLAARHFGLAEQAFPASTFYPVACEDWRALFQGSGSSEPGWFTTSHAVHLWNNMLSQEAGFDKNAIFPTDSPYERLCGRFLRDELKPLG